MTKRPYDPKWRENHPITVDGGVQHDDFDKIIPSRLKGIAHNIVGSPEENLRR